MTCWRHVANAAHQFLATGQPSARRAALPLLPYLLLVSIAGALNWQVTQLNGPF